MLTRAPAQSASLARRVSLAAFALLATACCVLLAVCPAAAQVYRTEGLSSRRPNPAQPNSGISMAMATTT
jgi:hypothetical protein